MLLGLKAGEKKVEEQVAAMGKKVNGWSIGAAFGDRDFYKVIHAPLLAEAGSAFNPAAG